MEIPENIIIHTEKKPDSENRLQRKKIAAFQEEFNQAAPDIEQYKTKPAVYNILKKIYKEYVLSPVIFSEAEKLLQPATNTWGNFFESKVFSKQYEEEQKMKENLLKLVQNTKLIGGKIAEECAKLYGSKSDCNYGKSLQHNKLILIGDELAAFLLKNEALTDYDQNRKAFWKFMGSYPKEIVEEAVMQYDDRFAVAGYYLYCPHDTSLHNGTVLHEKSQLAFYWDLKQGKCHQKELVSFLQRKDGEKYLDWILQLTQSHLAQIFGAKHIFSAEVLSQAKGILGKREQITQWVKKELEPSSVWPADYFQYCSNLTREQAENILETNEQAGILLRPSSQGYPFISVTHYKPDGEINHFQGKVDQGGIQFPSREGGWKKYGDNFKEAMQTFANRYECNVIKEESWRCEVILTPEPQVVEEIWNAGPSR